MFTDSVKGSTVTLTTQLGFEDDPGIFLLELK